MNYKTIKGLILMKVFSTEKSLVKTLKKSIKKSHRNYFEQQALTLLPILVRCGFALKREKKYIVDKAFLLGFSSFQQVNELAFCKELPKHTQLELRKWLKAHAKMPSQLTFEPDRFNAHVKYLALPKHREVEDNIKSSLQPVIDDVFA